MPPSFKKLDEYTLQVLTPLNETGDEWGGARLRRIFNFKAREVTTLYERGGKVDFKIPGSSQYVKEPASAVALTSAMGQRNFSDFDSMDEVIAMHAKLKTLGGMPPSIDDLVTSLPKKAAGLKAPQ